jgi:hypothetical protein
MKKIHLFVLSFMTIYTLKAQRLELSKDIIITQAVYENVYAAGNNLTINAPIHADLVTAGGTININDTIDNDILLAGGTVIFNGYVGGDVRCAGGTLNIKKDIKGDLVITGGTVTIDKDVSIGGNILVSGGELTLNGTAKGSIRGMIGKFTLNGTVDKNLNCQGGDILINGTIIGKSVLSAADITIGNEAKILDDVRYWTAKGTVDFKQALKNGHATFDETLKIDTGRWYYIGFASFIAVIWYLGMAVLMIFLTQYFFSNTMKRASDIVSAESIGSLGYGVLFALGVPAIMIVLFITIIGIPIALILLFAYITIMALGTVITAVVATNWLNTYNKSNWQIGQMVLVAMGVFIVLKLLSLTFVFGPLIMSIAALMAFGAILKTINWHKKEVVISN